MPATLSPQRLRSARQQAGLSQQETAVAAFLHVSSITKIERGVMTPSTPVLARLAEIYGCSIDSLFDETAAQQHAAVAGDAA